MIKGGITGNLSLNCVANAAEVGAVTGALAVTVAPAVQGGQNFNPLTSPVTFGPRAIQAYEQTTVAGVLGADANLSGRKNVCP